MRWWWLASVVAVGCASEPKDQGDDDDDDNAGYYHSGHTGDSGYEPPAYWDPAAVGFELEAIVRDDGTLTFYVQDGYEVGPWMILTFTSLAYFDAETAEEAEEQSCIALGRFQPSPLLPPAGIPLLEPDALWLSYEGAVSIEYDECAGKVNPDDWGADASILMGKFQGAHLGVGFGPMTDYLRDAWAEETIDEIGDSMFAQYIALNDASGAWLGVDWTTGIAFEWDEVSGELVADADGYLLGIDVTSVGYAVPFPQSYVRSFSYWYQDFPYLDLDNLTDGAP